ncbi:MAG: hypothetical protein RIQ54_242 [Candidatus Parcubacteria bacterium]|jgi:glyceraldehyde 3-phosphate dehydrogenase
MVRIAINGFGRIGRHFLRQVAGRSDFSVVAINDLGDLENLAYLLRYDTVYGRSVHAVGFDAGTSTLLFDNQPISFLQIKDPAQLPWRALGIDIVIEATGLFESYEKASVHIAAGCRRVIITAPAKDGDGVSGKTILAGVNESEVSTVAVSSNGSCTTNAASPVIAILSERPGIVKAMLSTVHSYTATQNIVDGPVKGGRDFRRGRAAAGNISPSTTGAAIAVTRALPALSGKFDGLAYRVPTLSGSLADITFIAARSTSADEINSILRDAAATPRWQSILKVTDEQLVSSDIIGEPYGAIVDTNFTKVIDGDFVKVVSWYDNEYGYVSTLIRHVSAVARFLSESNHSA